MCCLWLLLLCFVLSHLSMNLLDPLTTFLLYGANNLTDSSFRPILIFSLKLCLLFALLLEKLCELRNISAKTIGFGR
jgi:hypothetical protein